MIVKGMLFRLRIHRCQFKATIDQIMKLKLKSIIDTLYIILGIMFFLHQKHSYCMEIIGNDIINEYNIL